MKKHPNKHIAEAIIYAVNHGWEMIESSGHPFCRIKCPRGCHLFSIWSTPKHPEHHARFIERKVNQCERDNP